MTDTRLQPCGTDAAHARHIRRGEPPCEECRVARNEAQARRRRRRLRLAHNEAEPDLDTPTGWDDEELDQAACRPWTGSHDSRHTTETDREFNVRLAAARLVCRACPASTDCLRRARYLEASHIRIDGIFAGRHYRYGGDAG